MNTGHMQTAKTASEGNQQPSIHSRFLNLFEAHACKEN